MLDGVYNFPGDDVVELLSGPQSTWDALRKAAEVVRDAKAEGKSDEEAFERAAAALPALAKLKGRAKTAAVFIVVNSLFWLATKFADPHIERVTKGPERTDAQISAIVKDAVAHALAQRDKAARAAGVIEERRPPSPVAAAASASPTNSRKEVEQRRPHFAGNMAKLAREIEKKHPYYKAVRIQAELEESKRPQGEHGNAGESQADRHPDGDYGPAQQ